MLSRLTMEIFMTHKIVIDVIKYILIKLAQIPATLQSAFYA